jgi:hypothetical protein
MDPSAVRVQNSEPIVATSIPVHQSASPQSIDSMIEDLLLWPGYGFGAG